jgi:hypothetical protein
MVRVLHEEAGFPLLNHLGQHQSADVRSAERQRGLIKAPRGDNSSGQDILKTSASRLGEILRRAEGKRVGGLLCAERVPLQMTGLAVTVDDFK